MIPICTAIPAIAQTLYEAFSISNESYCIYCKVDGNTVPLKFATRLTAPILHDSCSNTVTRNPYRLNFSFLNARSFHAAANINRSNRTNINASNRAQCVGICLNTGQHSCPTEDRASRFKSTVPPATSARYIPSRSQQTYTRSLATLPQHELHQNLHLVPLVPGSLFVPLFG